MHTLSTAVAVVTGTGVVGAGGAAVVATVATGVVSGARLWHTV